MRIFLLLVGLLCGVNCLYLKENDLDASSDSLKRNLLEYLEEKSDLDSRGPQYAEYDEDFDPPGEEPDPSGQFIDTDENCEFDISQCKNSNCMLGFLEDDFGCPVSCECKRNGLFEGDIRVDSEDQDALAAVYGFSAETRAASKYLKRWNNLPTSDGKFNVPYVLTPSTQGNAKAVRAIAQAMEQYKKHTCIQFIPRTYERDYLSFFPGRGCYSYLGRRGGKQPVSIGYRCERKGTVMHELMHAMGFWHEHSRPDRDEHVTILMENVNPRMNANFNKISSRLVDSMGSPYDPGSVMHYHGYSFTKNRKPTIVLKGTMTPTKGQRDGFSDEDKKQLNSMYQCSKK